MRDPTHDPPSNSTPLQYDYVENTVITAVVNGEPSRTVKQDYEVPSTECVEDEMEMNPSYEACTPTADVGSGQGSDSTMTQSTAANPLYGSN